MPRVNRLRGLEILDSRGRPTVKATCELETGCSGTASVPSGKSVGTAEALERRDCDPKRYAGLGCRQAVRNIEGALNDGVSGRYFEGQEQFDSALLEIDGTPNKAHLGSNAILAVSVAFARASAKEMCLPLYRYFATALDETVDHLPRPTINLFSGGLHAGGQVPIQDVLIVPLSAQTMDDALALAFEVYRSAIGVTQQTYGTRPLTADEGGLAPPFPDPKRMLEDAVVSIRRAGLEPARDVALAVDVAATHFFRDGRYRFGRESLDSKAMIERLASWVDNYPIISIEDGLAEDDWEHWPLLREQIGGRALVLGDDLLCTNPRRVQNAIEDRVADALLLKVNQVGTITEANAARKLARSGRWSVTVSARSGETEDDWLADLAVGWSADQVKIGSITQSERLAKYNRLLEIEAETELQLAAWPVGR